MTTYDVAADRARAARADTPPPFTGLAFSAWAAAFAVALLHLWSNEQHTWSFGPLAAVAAFAVLLRPASPARLMLLLGLLLAEAATWLPDLSNHQILVAVLALTLIPWWLATAWRSPGRAHDPATTYQQVAPYLRLAFVLTWMLAALAKLNTGFLDAVQTCSVWVLESIPGVNVPTSLATPVIGGTLAIELAVPLLLLFHRTRPLAVVLGFGFHLVSAFAGHASFSGFYWSFYLLFLPPATIARAVVLARRSVPRRLRGGLAAAATYPWWAALVPGLVWWLGWLVLPASLESPLRNWGVALACAVWMGWCGWLLWRVNLHRLGAAGPRASLRVRHGLMLLGLGLLIVTAATPYLGLKSRAALTMFSNIRTEPGHWNHLLVPEDVRVFDWQDGEVRFQSSDNAGLNARIAEHGRARTVLLDLRRVAQQYPEATVRYRLDGVDRVARPVAVDPVLGAPITAEQRWFGAMRPYAEGGTCQH